MPLTRRGGQPRASVRSRVIEATRREWPSRPGPAASALPIIVPRITWSECDSESLAWRRCSRSSDRLTLATAVSVRSSASSAASVTARSWASGEAGSERSWPRPERRPRIDEVTRSTRSSPLQG